jgi:hypothetical protein
MQGMHRKTAPKVKSGRVQKKNRWAETTRLDSVPVVERERPGDGYRHLLKVRDIEGDAEEYARIHEDALWDACADRLGT